MICWSGLLADDDAGPSGSSAAEDISLPWGGGSFARAFAETARCVESKTDEGDDITSSKPIQISRLSNTSGFFTM
jgi:hypothetical protein